MSGSGPLNPEKCLAKFSGRAPIFPLPNVVHFPHLLLPLHIFEPRYRRMVADALAGDRMLAMALLKPGWDSAADMARPPVFNMACLGRITAEQRLPDGRYYLVLQGLSRAVILEEEDEPLPYRMARLEICSDQYATPSAFDRDERRKEMLAGFGKLHAEIDLKKVFLKVIEASVSLGIVCDVITDALKLPPVRAQQILSTIDVDRRSDLVLERIADEVRRRHGKSARPFPPLFSRN